MIKTHPIITYAYYFISEAIIIFLLILPVMHYYYQWVPYWGYLGSVGLVCLFFSFISMRTTNYKVYVLCAPILFAVFYMLGFPLFLSICLTAIFIWRYVWIRGGMVISKEYPYMYTTAALSMFMLILLKNDTIIVYLLLQFLVLIIGYNFSNIAVIDKQDRKKVNYQLVFYYIFILLLGGLSTYWVITQPIFLKLWDGFIYIFFSLVGRVLGIFQFLENTEFDLSNLFEGIQRPRMSGEDLREQATPLLETIAPGLIIWLGLGFVLVVVGIIVIIMMNKKDYSPLEKESYKLKNSFVKDLFFKGPKSVNSLLRKKSLIPQHQVRRVVYQFEKRVYKTQYGRKSFETIEDWLTRIGFSDHFEVYQKVRYGEVDVTTKEVGLLLNELKEIENMLENK